MSARLRGQARQTEQIVAAGGYAAPGGHRVSIAEEVAVARAGTRLFGPEAVPVPEPEPEPEPVRTQSARDRTQSAPERTRIEVTGESSLEAARRLTEAADVADVAEDPVAVLDFASARNPGGGYLNGAQAQEEALCRASALYTCLLEVPEFYDHHRTHRDPFYSDRVIHAPAVPVFRDDRGRLFDRPYQVGFLTSPAPNAGVIARNAPERTADVPYALAARAERVLETALACGYRRLVLGAWGCGVFRNDPAQVAEAFRRHIGDGGRFAGRFTHIVFGVLDGARGSRTRAAFEEAFPARTAQPPAHRTAAPSLSASRTAP
ncbi:TIGR02452 family protein [Streptomyces sp. NPDC059009]|uniref:TIGR02452 family protein n=1 Tax=Streptomyces sp. NPDC059009 TaxID=3346694 RepID=UPI003694FD05